MQCEGHGPAEKPKPVPVNQCAASNDDPLVRQADANEAPPPKVSTGSEVATANPAKGKPPHPHP